MERLIDDKISSRYNYEKKKRFFLESIEDSKIFQSEEWNSTFPKVRIFAVFNYLIIWYLWDLNKSNYCNI